MPVLGGSSVPTRDSLPGQAANLSVAIGIATRGRPDTLKETLADLALQTRPAEGIYVAYFDSRDVGDAPLLFPQVHFLQGSGGSCAQRNHLLDAAGDRYGMIFFMDDDFYLHRDYLLRMEQTFLSDPLILGATGEVIADGAVGPGLTTDYARERLNQIGAVPSLAQRKPKPAFNTYGCNMAFRVSALREYGIRFDEDLPIYAWFEDVDFSRRLLPHGKLVLVPGAQGVHLGIKQGRTSGKRLGYSQVANPIYMARKGTLPWVDAIKGICRHTSKNLLLSLRPEPYVDRRGRVQGNLLALWELLLGRMRPDRILQLH